ncbi:DUF4423 domain-containing protein [Bdellovibrio reynosensis]|uniref:DUF4423 domain-containing protein n=1 Tax=Bdellovibrio reynosensis TaxID=2835041 RepID=A0ABY4CAR5_9BACT|nr:DUF4423 domain-containing protein [Bdellovibrio reynosensis]UOF01559.1 DUF4423 domain-containing protein [Bdellovibrio reynosensis]
MSSNRFGDLLKSKLEDIQKKNPRFSFRSLAKKVGISPGCLNELMHGKRPLSEFYANKIVLGLELDINERNEIYSLIATRSRKFAVQKTLEDQELEMLTHWEHFAILNLFRMKNFQAEPEWIAGRLGIPVEKAENSLQLLMNLGFIKRKGNSIARAVASLSTTTDIPSQALVKAHISDLKKAIDVLQSTTPAVRDFSSITMAINPEKIEEAKKLIKKFRRKFSILVEEGDQTEVYNLNIQFFPLTRPEKDPVNVI